MSVDEAIAAIPEGWRIYTIDMSIEGRARVMLKGPMYEGEKGVSVPEFACEVRATLAEAIAVTAAEARNTYRGWTISQGRWPEPDWSATSPNYDASYEGEEDGWVDNGEKADAPTREALIEEIDAWFADRIEAELTRKESQ